MCLVRVLLPQEELVQMVQEELRIDAKDVSRTGSADL